MRPLYHYNVLVVCLEGTVSHLSNASLHITVTYIICFSVFVCLCVKQPKTYFYVLAALFFSQPEQSKQFFFLYANGFAISVHK